MYGGPLGALAGFALGPPSMPPPVPDDDSGRRLFDDDSTEHTSFGQQYGYDEGRMYEGQRNTFRFSLLVLASYIIRADGRVMHSEMNLVRQWLRTNFGEAAVGEGEEILRKLFDQQKRLGAAEYRQRRAQQLCAAQPNHVL